MGKLTPCLVQEVVPGDHFKVKTETLLRMSPMIAPVMHRLNIYVHYFFVPNRIIWSQWEDFITGGRLGTSSPTMPTLQSIDDAKWRQGSLADYMGLPVNTAGVNVNKITTTALPFRAYLEIWNEYFRDQTLEPPVDVETASDSDLGVLRDRCWEKDYFTSCLPWPQRGAEVDLPLEFSPQYLSQSESPNATGVVSADGGSPSKLETPTDPIQVVNLVDPQTGLSVTINDLRQSNALQRFLERNARGGYRYIEQILSHFGVRSSDSRQQRPEYLGGGRQPVIMSEVLNNTGETGGLSQGNMSGHGISVGTTNSFKRKFEEHGYA